MGASHQQAASEKKIVVVSTGEDARRKRKKALPQISLDRELEMVRPALLYGDSVTLMSNTYHVSEAMSYLFGSLELHPERIVEFFEWFSPLSPEVQQLKWLRSTYEKSLDRQERATAKKALSDLAQGFTKAARQQGTPFESIVDEAALAELNSAKISGILHIEDMPGFKKDGLAKVMTQMMEGIAALQRNDDPQTPEALPDAVADFVSRMVRYLAEANSYPILDRQARELVGLQAAGLDRYARERSKIGGVACFVLGLLPVVDVPLSQLAEVRVNLNDHLGAFRVAIAEFASEIEFAQWEPGFDKDVVHHYSTYVEPQVRDLGAKLSDITSGMKGRGKRRALQVGLTAAKPILDNWVSNTLLGAATLEGAMRLFVEKLVEDTVRSVRAQVSELATNKLFYYSALEHELLKTTDS